MKTIPDALRLAPGVQVARISSNQWAIGVRGFASRLSRSVLVLMDGRSVYNPLFAGTYWEVQDTVLEDIERIEVVRGPGGTLWGANAFNGVINIVTKAARDTQGLLAIAGGGTEERGFGTVRYGGALGDDLFYRGRRLFAPNRRRRGGALQGALADRSLVPALGREMRVSNAGTGILHTPGALHGRQVIGLRARRFLAFNGLHCCCTHVRLREKGGSTHGHAERGAPRGAAGRAARAGCDVTSARPAMYGGL